MNTFIEKQKFNIVEKNQARLLIFIKRYSL